MEFLLRTVVTTDVATSIRVEQRRPRIASRSGDCKALEPDVAEPYVTYDVTAAGASEQRDGCASEP
jgi:hypothetical protein